ncbi:outer membrane lipoprotein carrier protein LolA [Salinicoccus roseus]|uniref:LolA family protein n=1 Tax=Salinicoccus roseus TaxID=45670 RepID=UPI003525230A
MDRKFITVVLTAVLLMLGACTSEEGADSSMDQDTGGMPEKTASSGNQAEASEDISKEAVLENASEVDQQLENYYLESKMTTYMDGRTDETLTREWFYWKDGELYFRKEIERADAPDQYIVGNDQHSMLYTEGEDTAVRTANLVSGASLPSPSEAMKGRLSSYRMSHDSKLVGKEAVNGRTGHHLVFTPKEEARESGTTMDLWIDAEHWLTLKEVLDQGDRRMVYEVGTLVEGIEPAMDLFRLDLPEGVEVIDQ